MSGPFPPPDISFKSLFYKKISIWMCLIPNLLGNVSRQVCSLSEGSVQKGAVRREIQNSDKQLDGFLARIVETDNPTVIAANERKSLL